jgi:hypothetical protein
MLKYLSIIILVYALFAPKVFSATPLSVNSSIKSNFTKVDSFRADTYRELTNIRKDTQRDIDRLSIDSKKTKVNNNSKPLDKTELPIAYIKLLLISSTSFVFSTVLIFYVVCAVFLFMILRYFYRKIRNR